MCLSRINSTFQKQGNTIILYNDIPTSTTKKRRTSNDLDRSIINCSNLHICIATPSKIIKLAIADQEDEPIEKHQN